MRHDSVKLRPLCVQFVRTVGAIRCAPANGNVGENETVRDAFDARFGAHLVCCARRDMGRSERNLKSRQPMLNLNLQKRRG